jgi:antitoxin FitA
MAAVTIRKLPDEVHAVLKRRAKEKGRSTEAEIRETLILATQPPVSQIGFGTELHQFWKKQGSPELKVRPRTALTRIVDFSGSEFGSDDL